MDHFGIERFHLVGAKIGGTIARAFAARRASRIATLTLIGTPTPFRPGTKERTPAWTEVFEKKGVEHWARQSMAGRLGDKFPKEGAEWWTKFMGRTDAESQIGFIATIACADITPDMPNIACPTLVITTEQSGLASVEETRAWQKTIRNSELLVLPGNSYHVAATDPERCAQATLEFMAKNSYDRVKK